MLTSIIIWSILDCPISRVMASCFVAKEMTIHCGCGMHILGNLSLIPARGCQESVLTCARNGCWLSSKIQFMFIVLKLEFLYYFLHKVLRFNAVCFISCHILCIEYAAVIIIMWYLGLEWFVNAVLPCSLPQINKLIQFINVLLLI